MPTELMALIDAYAATSAVNGIRSQWAQMARGKVELALKQLPAPQMHTDAGDAELIQALGDLSFACFAGIGTQAPDAETFNRTFAVLEKHRALLATATGLPAHSVPDGWREQFAAEVYADLAAADNQDVPLEEYPARILKVLGDIVGPRHPVVIQWRNDAIKNCIAIAYKYCRDPESYKYLKQDLEAMLTAEPAPKAQADARYAQLLAFAVSEIRRDEMEHEPVLYVSKGQLGNFRDPDGPDSTAHGRYLPARVTPAGKFTTPLFAAPQAEAADFQQRVQPWMMACFGPEISADRSERNHRFLEEALELVQSCGCTASEAHQLVDYVYSRPWGEPAQEAGGVMVTLAALCLANGLDMHECGETELARIWTKVEAIRAKQAAKPKHSPLPMQAPQTQDGLRLAFVLSEIRRDGMDALSAALHDLDGFPLDHQASVEAIDRAAIAAAKGEQQ